MFTRREVLLAAASSGIAPRSRRLTGSILLSNEGYRKKQGPVIRVRLDDADVSAVELTHGLADRDTGGFADMEINLGRTRATVEWLPTGEHWSCRLEHGARAFVAGWAIPVLTCGYIGFDPAWAWPPLHAAGVGDFFHLPAVPTAPLPAALASTRAVYACFIGDWGDLMLSRFDAMAQAVSDTIPSNADFIFNGGYLLNAAPAVLLTAFGANPSGQRGVARTVRDACGDRTIPLTSHRDR